MQNSCLDAEEVILIFSAREPLWEDGVDYRCGTGHGVGYFLGVHEGPNASLRWRSNPENLDAVLQPGMVITDKPGVYVPGKYGIRTENMPDL